MSKAAKTTKPTKAYRFFRVAVEGATTDGRKIERAHLEQMAEHYDRDTYSATVCLEHYKGMDPEGLFKNYGVVAALKTEEVEIGGKTKLALFAQIEPTADLVALNRKGQKLFTSIEINPEFADSGAAYLQSLAITDNPASLGTEALEFAAKNPKANPWTARKTEPDNVVTEALEFSLQLEEGGSDDDSTLTKFKNTVAGAVAMFKRRGATDNARFDAMADGVTQMGEAFSAHADSTDEALAKANEQIEQLTATVGDMEKKFAALEREPGAPRRPVASGGNAEQQTDC